MATLRISPASPSKRTANLPWWKSYSHQKRVHCAARTAIVENVDAGHRSLLKTGWKSKVSSRAASRILRVESMAIVSSDILRAVNGGILSLNQDRRRVPPRHSRSRGIRRVCRESRCRSGRPDVHTGVDGLRRVYEPPSPRMGVRQTPRADTLQDSREGYPRRDGESPKHVERMPRLRLGYRPQQATFKCTNDACWVGEYQADVNGAVNIADRCLSGESLQRTPERR